MNNVSRLSALKNNGKRRVKDDSSEEDGYDLDLSASSLSSEPPNLPEVDMGGELSSQSYDVRANQVIDPAAQAAADAFDLNPVRRLGRALGRNAQQPAPQEPPIETRQVDEQEGLPPVSASQQMAAEKPRGSFLGDVGNLFSRLGSSLMAPLKSTPEERAKNRAENQAIRDSGNYLKAYQDSGRKIGQAITGVPGQIQQSLQEGFEENARRINPELAQPPAQEMPTQPTREEVMAQIDEAQQNPEGAAVYGAANEIANTPELAAQFTDITGMDMNDPLFQETAKVYEALLTGQEQRLGEAEQINTEQIDRIKERIANNEATDADKFYIGLALALPLIIGGVFGKEAALGAAGGAAQGFAGLKSGKQKSITEAEEMMSGLNKEKASLGAKRGELDLAKLGKAAAVKQMLPPHRDEFLKGKKRATWTDPATGEQKNGVLVKPGFVAEPQYLTSKDDLHIMEKAAEELNPIRAFTHELTDLSDGLVDIASQIKDKDGFSKLITSYMSGKLPKGSLSKLTQDVMIDGRMQNAGIAIENKLGLLKSAYARAKKLGQMDRATQDHFESIFTNPTNTFASAKDLIDQLISMKELAQDSFVREASGRGFASDFLVNDFSRKNRESYNKLNKKEEMKESDALLKV